MQSTIRNYLSVTKPRIILSNLITVLGGYFAGLENAFNFTDLIVAIVATAFIIGGSCVLNNLIDIEIDKKMERTKNRVTVLGLIPKTTGILYGIFLLIIGEGILYFFGNTLSFAVGLVGIFYYVVVYSLLTKRFTLFGTMVGGVSGAVPPLIGYLIVKNEFDFGAVILFFILFVWQIPHSFAIYIYRLEDFRKANIPVLPVKKSMQYTKINILVYTILFIPVAMSLTFVGVTGTLYLIISAVLSSIWLGISIKGFFVTDHRRWAKKYFIYSTIMLSCLFIVMIF